MLRASPRAFVSLLFLSAWACGASRGEGASERSTSEEGTASEGTASEGTTTQVEVTWLEVAASDYKLELVPSFTSEQTIYQAIADGPDIEVYVDVILDADVEGVEVNGVLALPNGFRAWRSAPETGLVSPTSFVLEIVGASAPSYHVDVVLP